ncbi:MAG TPA: protein translocase subunit SecD [Actinomycetota bacterium]|nr:protein translocase subunit SecD [Actinomycetota bacterium]
MKQTRRLKLSLVFVGILWLASAIALTTGLRPQYGLDLVGGISVTLEAPAGTDTGVLQRAADNIRGRIDQLGVAEPQVSIVGDRDIQVEVPGLAKGTTVPKAGRWCAEPATGGSLQFEGKVCNFPSQASAESAIQSVGQQRLLDLIGRTARLEEREVTSSVAYDPKTVKLTGCSPDVASQVPQCRSVKFTKCPPQLTNKAGCTDADLSKQTVTYLTKPATDGSGFTAVTMGPVELTGDQIAKATAVFQTASSQSVGPVGWEINFSTTKSGAAALQKITTRLLPNHGQLAIVLDRQVESAPQVNGVISTQGQITGSFSEQEAKDLALVLNEGALPVELKKLQVETVSPTLGKQSLHAGLIAGIAGLLLLMLYLAFYYRLLGIVTWAGMIIWATFALTIVALAGNVVGYALSLAGIAGIIVSMGITADSYIVFYERLKDEVRGGKTLRTSVQPAFKRAWHTIVAADIVTILAAAVLYLLAIGSVRGFALTLGFATALDMFVVYFFKRPVVFLMARSERIENLRGMGLRSGIAADPVPGEDAIPAIAGAAE